MASKVRWHIKKLLKRGDHNYTEIADILGISRGYVTGVASDEGYTDMEKRRSNLVWRGIVKVAEVRNKLRGVSCVEEG
jgi:hypothetical protein